jgi:hypothetical protein
MPEPGVNSAAALLFKDSNLFLGACLDTIVVSFPGFFCPFSSQSSEKAQQDFHRAVLGRSHRVVRAPDLSGISLQRIS